MRLYVNILKHAGQGCTNGGVTDFSDEAVLVWDETPEQMADLPNNKCVLILEKGLGHHKYRALPYRTDKGKWHMFGGNFIHSSDSRFPFDYPIDVHDRIE